MKRAIVLLSGGMDSLVTTAIAAQECDELHLLHFSYGQRTEVKEKWCFQQIANHYKAREARIVDYRWLADIGGSALTDKELKLNVDDSVPNTYVPFRNATMLCAAVAWAEVIQAQHIYIGAVEEDSSGYPDCRQSFFTAMTELIKQGTLAANIGILTPVLHLSKSEIVKLGISLNAPFELSWSCYFANYEACGECPSCLLRLKAFAKANTKDPIPYKVI
ncbi:MAG: 7-cyano-7-deazaguanine synthase QueC [Candidatus Cloacimonetes bacterium]|nr:7-cyano-7-deazaguanine synthase QueC [Candidatus Cloacimonadota bacterium]MDD2506969.1 7-cyano-7-deazaguanine synthase QueC [Candidatus Cloacimonadota bacterium]MDD4560496.1 7-cyano-7-deazaguanine synthase QueC [Candidatus Cloacimonadota bacterium]